MLEERGWEPGMLPWLYPHLLCEHTGIQVLSSSPVKLGVTCPLRKARWVTVGQYLVLCLTHSRTHAHVPALVISKDSVNRHLTLAKSFLCAQFHHEWGYWRSEVVSWLCPWHCDKTEKTLLQEYVWAGRGCIRWTWKLHRSTTWLHLYKHVLEKLCFPSLSKNGYWNHLSSHFPVVGICCGIVIVFVSKQHVCTMIEPSE